MKKLPCTLALAALSVASVTTFSEESSTASSLNTTRATLQKWVETQQTLSREKRDWQLGKDVLEQRIDLLRSEVGSLEQKIAEVEKLTAEADQKRAALLGETAILSRATSGLGDLVVRLEARTNELLPRLPAPLAERIRPLSARLPKGPAPDDLTLGQRFQNVIGILNEVNRFNSDVTLASEVRTLPDGTSAEVKTVYLGLAQAYYVTVAGDIAGVGRPSAEGWNWSGENGIADEVSRVVGILEAGEVPAFVPLPSSIE